jgi:putative heme transporter
MTNQTDQSSLRRVGSASWMMLGVIFLVATVYVILASLSGLVTPLVIAAVVGILFVPVVERLTRYMPRPFASGLVLLGLVVLGFVTVAITVAGIVDQAPQIQAQVTAGVTSLFEWLGTFGLTTGDPTDLVDSFQELLAGLIPGLASFITGAFSSVASFAIGTFAAVFFLYFVLADWDEVSDWVGSHLGVPDDLGGGVIEDTVWSMREYFYVLTVSSLVTAVLVGGTMAALALPLAAAVALVTFVTSYIPYLGAIFSGAFAFLVALGSGDMTDALIVLAAILIIQNVVQPVIQTKYTKKALHLHPIVTFGSTIVGAVLAGILGATLSAPIVAMTISINRRIRSYRASDDATVGEA